MIPYDFKGDKVSQIENILKEFDVVRTSNYRSIKYKFIRYEDENGFIHIHYSNSNEDNTLVNLFFLDENKDLIRELSDLLNKSAN